MADETPKSIYEQAKESTLKHMEYSSVMQAIQEGKFVPDLTDRAEKAAKEVEEEILKEDGKINLETDNINQLYDYIKGAAQKFAIRTNRLFEKNLEEIISNTPQKAMEGVEKMLFNFLPKEKVEGEYKDVAKLHRQIVHMNNVMGAYVKEQDEGNKKDLRDDVMSHEIAEYYNSLYKDGKSEDLAKENAALLAASIKWTKRNPRLCEAKYQWLLGRKKEQFRSKLIGISWKEYKAIKKQDDDEKNEWDRETEAEIENEADDYVKQQHRQRRNEQRKREHLGDKISKKIPDYLRNAMDSGAMMNMYARYWQKEAQEKAQRQE